MDDVVDADEQKDRLWMKAPEHPVIEILRKQLESAVAAGAGVDHHLVLHEILSAHALMENLGEAAPAVGVPRPMRDGIAVEDPCPRFGAAAADMLANAVQVELPPRPRQNGTGQHRHHQSEKHS